MSQAITLARPYARAAFSLARDRSAVAQWSSALAVSAAIAADATVAALLKHPSLGEAEAVELVKAPSADPICVQFLQVLAENNRLGLLPEVFAQFEVLRAESERVVKAKVTSATTLSDADIASLKASLKKRFEREVEIETAIDPELIGGAVIDTGDLVIDGSLKTKLARLGAALAN